MMEQEGNTSMHMKHKSGDKMYVDYTGDKLSFVDQVKYRKWYQ